MSNTCETVTGKKAIHDTVAAESKRIVDNVRYTDYRHHTEVDEFTGTYIMDCSGFVSYVLERVAPAHFAMIPKEVDQPRPRAFEFYEYFSALKAESDGWHPIHRIAHVRKGDIISWRHLGSMELHKDTGHVLIVAQTPSVQADDVYSVSVYDSSDIPHNDDTRRDGVTGVGMGEIKFRADCDGRPTSFQFKVRDLFYSYPIAMGRPEAFIEPDEIKQRERDRVEAERLEKERLDAQQRKIERSEAQQRKRAERPQTNIHGGRRKTSIKNLAIPTD